MTKDEAIAIIRNLWCLDKINAAARIELIEMVNAIPWPRGDGFAGQKAQKQGQEGLTGEE